MRELSLHILDIAENGIRAGADRLQIHVEESSAADRLTFSVEDNGGGMPAEKAARIDDPFVTTRKTRRVGLGLSLLAAAARRCEGDISVETSPEKGTRVTASFRRSHIDCAPLGDMVATMEVLIVGNPHIDFCYTHRVDGKEFVLDTRDFRMKAGGHSLSDLMIWRRIAEAMRRSLAELATGSNPTPPMEDTDASTNL
jgi:anti-sigma regulatory factor (Ser/Thr protein kinase)